ncbi:MAG: hypothetical protein A2172_02620 [Candidatus Woykebacteria bacterium RBG_13_40_15]|uniref:PEGA domain-containing protein n=1 Tax=Candidatus Woykebacteria bacterium RBG_13_40_15 TaxID=1802593 RepID=A0A1G1W6G4_9BACT|nr:MAG: hypothetical protein A2172_02620 [Candidatus Woykebacteria bacterium RBG_13_40_15]
MNNLSKMKSLFGLLTFLIVTFILTTGLIFYAKGYRFNLKGHSVDPTGIVTVKSKPSGASVYINGEKKGLTDLDITDLSPNKYTIKIVKEGFFPWEKEIEVKKEAVKLVEVVLIPTAPSLKALTFTGVSSFVLAPDLSKIVFSVTEKGYAGIWALSLSTRQLINILSPKQLTKIVTDTSETSFSTAPYSFAPDGKKILVKAPSQNPRYFILDPSTTNESPQEISADETKKIETSWENKTKEIEVTELKALGSEAQELATTLSQISFSPDKTKFIGTNKEGVTFLFDSKLERNSSEKAQSLTLPLANNYIWYPDSKHLVLVNNDSISLIETDGTNHTVIYTGNFDHNLVAPTNDGSKIIILTTLNSSPSKLPNLYAIELR